MHNYPFPMNTRSFGRFYNKTPILEKQNKMVVLVAT